MEEGKKNCFIIMPITIPEDNVEYYNDDTEHFMHVLNHLIIPSLAEAGFKSISPITTGSDIIHAEIIKHLSTSDLVLCDMSVLNPNVFFEFGIRTALNKPISLVVDDKTSNIPFDISIINFHRYDSSLELWKIEDEIKSLSDHIKNSYINNYNSLWKYFGIAQTGEFSPEMVTLEDKVNYLMKEMDVLKKESTPELIKIKEQIVKPTSVVGNAPGSLAEIEKDAIIKTLLYTGGNKSQAARELGISRSTLREKLKLYNISYA